MEPVAVLPTLQTSKTDMPSTAPKQMEHELMDESTQPPPASTSHSEARDLLLLQDYVRNVFPALAELAKRGLLAPDTWNCKRAQISLKATIDVPMLGTIIEQNGDGLLEQSHMPVGWPLHIDGAVRQNCAHRDATLQELDDLLGEYDLKRDLVEINHKAPQWSHNAVWNKKYMEPKPGFTLKQLWADSEPSIAQKTQTSYEVQDNDIRRAVTAISAMPAATLPDSAFLVALGTPALLAVPPQTGSLAQRAIEEWERNLCEKQSSGNPRADADRQTCPHQERWRRNAHCHRTR